jgi:hypothetical protein
MRRVAVMPGGHRVIIFGFLPQNLKTVAVAVAFSIAWREPEVEGGVQDRAPGVLAAFRVRLYQCFTSRPDALFELADAVVCRQAQDSNLGRLSPAILQTAADTVLAWKNIRDTGRFGMY